MTDYKEATYLELENYKAPKGIKCFFIPMKDNKKIRLAFWKKNKSESRGTIILQQGHNEFIEKYYETIQELIDRDFEVVSFDWRGQGMSERMTEDIHKQYIKDFVLHNEDLKFIIRKVIKGNFTEPLIAFGHSMGGNFILSSLFDLQKEFKFVILSAPMLGFKYEKILFLLSYIADLFMSPKSYFPGSKPNMGKETPFEENDLTTDLDRYQRTQKLVKKNPDIRLWGVTNAWVKAAKKSLTKIRKKGWAENVKSKILIVNSLEDKVVSPNRILEMHKRLPNSVIVNFKNTKHEILMENDKSREKFWKSFDKFLLNKY